MAEEDADRVLKIASESGEQAYRIGSVSKTPGVQFQGEQDGSLDEK
ncbi:MAG TPA: hypothetical protein VK947_12515 [Planococcus sp. (in: firmicutes)]|nr:hypothetical protein [Planococcus sp. (in: firmicutes)]